MKYHWYNVSILLQKTKDFQKNLFNLIYGKENEEHTVNDVEG